MFACLSKKCIGLNPEGYSALLGEVTLTYSRIAEGLSAMSTPEDDSMIVSLNLLPSELKEGTTEKDVEAEEQRVRAEIFIKTIQEIVEADAGKQVGERNMWLLRELGSDLNVNAFACNFEKRRRDLERRY